MRKMTLQVEIVTSEDGKHCFSEDGNGAVHKCPYMGEALIPQCIGEGFYVVCGIYRVLCKVGRQGCERCYRCLNDAQLKA